MEGEQYLEPAWLAVAELEPGVVQLGHRVDQAEAQAAAGGRAVRVQADEALLGMLALVGRDAGAGVGDRHRRGGAGARCATGRVPPGGRVLDRVVGEVGDRLGHELAVAQDGDAPARSRAASVDAALLGQRLVELDHVARQLGEVDPLPLAVLRCRPRRGRSRAAR